MRVCRFIVLALLAIAVAGCMRQPAPALSTATPLTPAAYAPAGDSSYRLDAGDRLRVTVFGQEGLTNAYIVDAGGSIAMPLIGLVHARGMTTTELSQAIAARLKQGYIREPHVAVEVESYRPFFILGEVANPGQYPYVAHMTVETAVAIAGGFTPRAYRTTVQLTRPIGNALSRGTVPATYPVQPGDTINVSERFF
jgi:polysaccharide export outer membrane protein